MKRFLTAILSLSLLLTSFTAPLSANAAGSSGADQLAVNSYTYDELTKLPSEPVFENIFLPASSKWLEYVGNEQPATFAKDKIKYVLADNVIKVNNISDSLADRGQILSGSTVQKLSPGRIVEKGGYISKSVLDSAAGKEIKNGSVIVDEAEGTAFKISSETEYSGIFDADPELSKLVKPLEGTYSVAQPELHEVVKSFELKEDTIQLNKANITGFAPNVESAVKTLSATPLSVGAEDKKFKYLTENNLIELDFKDVTALQGMVGNSTISVGLSGGIAISGISLTGRYSCNGGYEISMSLQQECYLVATLDAEAHEEIRVPILGLDIPFGIGRVYGGIFAVIGMDGTIRLDIEARETSTCKMGVEGGTFLYVPTSFHPIFEPEPPKMSGDCGLTGQTNGFIKFGPMLGLELFGFDVVGAGVLLGAGVHVDSDGVMMDVELYGCIDVYVALAGKHFNLLNARPTIYKKQQPDMHGYRVSFLEAFVNPGRVGGLIEEEPQQSGGAYLPSVGLEYKIWIVPKKATGSFDKANRESILSAEKANAGKPLEEKVRTYPDGAFAKTNAEGEFYEVDQDICYDGDQVWLEFVGKVKDKNGNTVPQTFFVGPVTPILPFTEVTILSTDMFNDYITGKVEPKRLIKWDANRLNPDEIQTELTYYQGPIFISPFNDYGLEPGTNGTKHLPYAVSGTAHTTTNEKGEFDTRNPWRDKNGKLQESGKINVLDESVGQYPYYENGEKKYASVYPPAYLGVLTSLQINKAVKNTTFYGITPGMPDFQITRTMNYVAGSYKKLTEGGKLVNQMQYDEYIWIANPTGTRAVTADMLDYVVTGFSSQDYKGYSQNPVKTTREGEITLTPVLDDNGKPTGAALYAQRVTVQWAWQAHPNPIKITSSDHTQTVAGTESTFQVKADGFFPLYSLEGAPQRVWVDEKTGLLHIPQTVSPGEYTFTIHVKEGIAITAVNGSDPKKGNDSSPPDKQTFTLTITQKPDTTSPQETSDPPVTSTPEPGKRTPPVIYKDEYNNYFNMDGSKDLTVSFQASGSTPITWSLLSADGGSVPAGITINASTGVLTANKSLAAGTYTFTVKASNDMGSDLHTCTLVMAAPLTAPVLENRRDGYQFSMSRAATDFSIQLKASGSSPIVYSIEAVNARIPVPSEVTVNASTGVLRVKGGLTGGIQAGVYEFKVKASNAAGSDTKSCKLTVTTPISPGVAGLSLTTYADSEAVPLAVKSNEQNPNVPSYVIAPDLFGGKAPPNKLTVRCDDPKDVYTHDRESYNGAYFIHWDTRIEIRLATVTNASYSSGSTSSLSGQITALIGQTVVMNDNTPVCDRYHYYDPTAPDMWPLSKEGLEKIRSNIKKVSDEEVAAYKNGYITVQKINTNDITKRYSDLRVNPLDKVDTGLEYGTLVSEIAAEKGGAYTVDLNADTGTVVSGEYFTALKGNPKADLTFRQEGAAITFSGKDIKTADALELLNIGFTFALHEKAMLDSIGAGYECFTYGFQYHGALPGRANFAITTTLSEGQKVNVYKFDAASGKYILIAKGVTVGEQGVVTYSNNTMSEYMITTKDIKGAELSDMIRLFDPARGTIWWAIGAVLLLALAAGIIWFFIRRRKRQRSL